VFYFVLDNYQHQRTFSTIIKDQGVLPEEELIRLMDSMSEPDVGLFRRMYKNGLFELVGADGSFEFGLKLILLGIEQVIKEQGK
jgi:TetR/AcrR family transcriptional regulator, tetracycline repressor protein